MNKEEIQKERETETQRDCMTDTEGNVEAISVFLIRRICNDMHDCNRLPAGGDTWLPW